VTVRRYLAIDLGAESGRAIVGELSDGRLHMREIARFENRMVRISGRLHWNIFELFEQIKGALKTFAKTYKEPPVSIGLDTWGVDFGLLASDGSILGLPYAYRDKRTEGAVESFFRRMDKRSVYEKTGIQTLPINTLFQLESMVRDNSPLIGATKDLLFIPDLLHYLLTGKKVTEFTFATTSQLFNPRLGDWDEELIETLGVPGSWFQAIVKPGTVIGTLSDEVSRETGLDSTPVVAVATHDTGSAVAAVPSRGEGWAFISSGTWSLMGFENAEPILTEQAESWNFTNEGGVENTFRVLKNITGLWLLQQCRKVWSKTHEMGYEALTTFAKQAKPLVSLIDPDCPEFANPREMPSAIEKFCRRTVQPVPSNPGAFTRCILESLALKYRHVLGQINGIAPGPISRIHVVGGGAQNRLLCQFTANATGLPVVAGPVEATAIGNLLVQAMAAGKLRSLSQIREAVHRSFELETFEPREPEKWDAAYERFLQLNPV
jgi:rhamnulokinase